MKGLPKDRLGRLFAGFVLVNAVIIAVLGWQAVESQEVKGSLKGGVADTPVEIAAQPAAAIGGGVSYVNEGDRLLTLEAAELIEPINLELVEIRAREPGALEPQPLEGFDVAPDDNVEIVFLMRVTGPGPAGFTNLRLQYRAGGRAGQTP